MYPIDYEGRACDICGSSDFEVLYEYEKTAITKSDSFLWRVRNVICKHCGFVFVSPSPIERDLALYYRNSFEKWEGQKLDYSIEKRISTINKLVNSPANKALVEFGGNNDTEFRKRLISIFREYKNIEINESCVANSDTIDSLVPSSVDVVCSYFVLEHIPNPAVILKKIYDRLKEEGILILEVPNLYSYPKYSSAIFLHEHTNHFSPYSLLTLLTKIGYSFIHMDHYLCSRPFGFTIVVKKDIDRKPESIIESNNLEYFIAKASFMSGLRNMQENEKQFLEVEEALSIRSYRDCVIWGANQLCLHLLTKYTIDKRVHVIDSNPQKKGTIHGYCVSTPSEKLSEIQNARFFVICTNIHCREIIAQIETMKKAKIDPDNYIVLSM